MNCCVVLFLAKGNGSKDEADSGEETLGIEEMEAANESEDGQSEEEEEGGSDE